MDPDALIHHLGTYLRGYFERYAILLSNGGILASTLEEGAVLKLIRFVKNMKHELEPTHYLRKKKLAIFRVTKHIFVVFLTALPDEEVIPVLGDILARFGENLDYQFPHPPSTLRDILTALVFSMAREMGPEPVAWFSPSNHFSADRAMDIAMKSLILLAGEMGGADKSVLSHIPFVKSRSLGVNYMFDIPSRAARGEAYDSALTMLVDYSNRGVIYEKSTEIEQFCRDFADNVRKYDLDEIKTRASSLLEDLFEKSANMPLKQAPVSDDLKKEMMASIDLLRKITQG